MIARGDWSRTLGGARQTPLPFQQKSKSVCSRAACISRSAMRSRRRPLVVERADDLCGAAPSLVFVPTVCAAVVAGTKKKGQKPADRLGLLKWLSARRAAFSLTSKKTPTYISTTKRASAYRVRLQQTSSSDLHLLTVTGECLDNDATTTRPSTTHSAHGTFDCLIEDKRGDEKEFATFLFSRLAKIWVCLNRMSRE